VAPIITGTITFNVPQMLYLDTYTLVL
jgi:hypothetical protein